MLSCDLRTDVKTAAHPTLKPLGWLTFALLVEYTRVTSNLTPTFLADGGEGLSSVEKNGDQCRRSGEENREEHGEHAGNVHSLPHRNKVGVTPLNLFCCCRVSSDCIVSESEKKKKSLTLFILFAGQLKVSLKGRRLQLQTLCGDATVSLNSSERIFWSRTRTSLFLRSQRNG